MAHIEASAVIAAPADRLYNIIADYHDGHQRILPRPPFVSMTVEQGGIGSGTVILVEMQLLGQRQAFRASVAEPQPGRVLVENNDTGYVTTFTVDRLDADSARVTIATKMPQRSGLAAKLERMLVPRLLRPVYARELQQLEAVATMQAT